MSKQPEILLFLTRAEVDALIAAADYRAKRLADMADMTTHKQTELSAREESAKYGILAAKLMDLLAAQAGEVAQL